MKTRRCAWWAWLIVVAVPVAATLAWQPGWAWYHLRQARQALELRDHDRALAQLLSARRMAGPRSDVEFWLARTYRRQGQLPTMSEHLERAWRLGADKSLLEREQWLAQAQSGQLRETEPHLAKLLQMAGDDLPDVCQAYVSGFFANLRFDEADALLAGWEKDFPNDPEPHFLRGHGQEMRLNAGEAVSAYRRGLQLAPHRQDMRLRLARVHLDR